MGNWLETAPAAPAPPGQRLTRLALSFEALPIIRQALGALPCLSTLEVADVPVGLLSGSGPGCSADWRGELEQSASQQRAASQLRSLCALPMLRTLSSEQESAALRSLCASLCPELRHCWEPMLGGSDPTARPHGGLGQEGGEDEW